MFSFERTHFVLLFPFLLAAAYGNVSAQDFPSVPAYPVDEAISVNGVLDEDAWQHAKAVTDFRQFEPDEGAAASMRTEVKVLYGNGNLYIGAMLYDEDPSGIERTLGRRDEYNRADWFLVSIDSYFNRRNAYTFGLNAAGVQFDAIRTGGGGGPGGPGGGGPVPPGMDPSWDAIWYSEALKTDRGWIVELQIPYSMLRFPEAESQIWGIHFTRRIPRLGEVDEWPLVPRSERTNLVAQFGRLTEIEDIEPRPNLQIRPYTVAGLNSRESVSDPGKADVNTDLDIGGDLKVGLGPNITLDATINPDFGQVESDPAVLNLTAFETTFDEKRPFFIEGIQIYEFSVGPGELLYTRRIGSQYPIIGATKISGRTERGLSFGILGASSGSNFNPTRNFGVGRVSQQIGDYSEAGGILTGFDGPATGVNGRLRTLTGGIDYDIRFLDNRYGVEGFTAFTHRSWSAPGLDSSTGFAGKVWFRKRQGVLTGFTGLDIFNDQFNPNDLGQLNENNFIANLYSLEYQINSGEPFGPVRRADLSAFGIQQFSYDERLNLGLSLEIGSNWTLMNFQTVQLGVDTQGLFGGYDLYETRGLGPWARPSFIELTGAFNSDERRNWQVGPEASITFHSDGGHAYELAVEGSWNIGTRLSFSGNVGSEWEDEVTAWVSNETFLRQGTDWRIGNRSLPPAELGNTEYTTFDDESRLDEILGNQFLAYYVPVFGTRDTRSLDFTLRSDVTFTQKLSLQVYSQLFLARGKYDNFAILQNPDNLADFPAYPKRSAFTLSSLQSNMVFRWEYRPGSNIYLVWTHGRRLRETLNPLAPHGPSPYERSIGKRISDTFDIFPSNALLLKIDYAFLY